MVHTAVVLPRALIEQLRSDADRSERGLSTEIRQRLLATYDAASLPYDPKTSELVEFTKSLVDSLASDLGKEWHESRYVQAAFTGGLLAFLAQYAPEGDAGTRDIAGHHDNPEAVGRTHARLIMAARRSSERKE